MSATNTDHPIYLSKLSKNSTVNTLIILQNDVVHFVRWRFRKDQTEIISRTSVQGNIPTRLKGYRRLAKGSIVVQ